MTNYWQLNPDEYKRCLACAGTGTTACRFCKGEGGRWVYQLEAVSNPQPWSPCVHCAGRGWQMCYPCGGTGSIKR